MRFNDGRIYKGYWLNGLQHGDGLFINPKGVETQGVWKEGRLIKFWRFFILYTTTFFYKNIFFFYNIISVKKIFFFFFIQIQNCFSPVLYHQVISFNFFIASSSHVFNFFNIDKYYAACIN